MSHLSAAFESVVGGGGVVVFPSDTVYGLACDPDNPEAIARMYALKGRPDDKPSARMYFRAEPALALLPPRTRGAVAPLLPGGLTLVVGKLGLRVPDVPLLHEVGIPVLQTSANHSGGPDARRLEDVPEDIRAAADLLFDGGELPGTPSTVVDLGDYEEHGTWRILRLGAVSEETLRKALG